MTLALALSVIIGITVHEAAHAWVALQRGDPTAAVLGRCSMRPWRHLDLLGSVMVPIVAWALLGVVAGYGRPVPLDRARLGRLGYLLAVGAGPGANLLLALLCLLLGFRVAADVNLMLAGVNLLPLPGLDGGRITEEITR